MTKSNMFSNWLSRSGSFCRNILSVTEAPVVVQDGSEPHPSAKFKPKPQPHPISYFIPILIFVIGLGLMIYMITVESEPGAIPMLLILIGGAWLLVLRFRFRSSAK